MCGGNLEFTPEDAGMIDTRAKREARANRHFLSLFSGAMGLDLGIEQVGFHCSVCNEIDQGAIRTIRHNRPALPIIEESVEKVGLSELSKAAGHSVRGIDLVVGGPPCQAFSVFGQRRGIEDSRGKLIFEFARIIDEVKPKTFIMENVRGLHSMPIMSAQDRRHDPSIPTEWVAHGSLLRELFRRFEVSGYRVDCFVVNVVNYGGPQIRERLLCIGNRMNMRAEFQEPQYSNRPADRLPPFRTLRDAIGHGFVDPDPSLMNFSPRKLKYLAMVPPGGNWRSLPVDTQKESMGKSWYLKGGRSAYWRKLHFDFPCPTVVTMPNHAGTSMCHPEELRALTVGEMAAVQEFPPRWQFQGSPTEKCRQIGNAVPPRLGRVAGAVVLELLDMFDTVGRKSGKRAPSTIRHVRPHVRTRSYFKDGRALAGKHCYYEKDGAESESTLFDLSVAK
jgi:DNA (cytosine-5)-methyltransferase 1